MPNVCSLGFHTVESMGLLERCTDEFHNKEDASGGRQAHFLLLRTALCPDCKLNNCAMLWLPSLCEFSEAGTESGTRNAVTQ